MTASVNRKAKEADLRSILRDERRFPAGRVSFAEFGFGGDPGMPDCWIARPGRGWIPVEAKLGNSVVRGLRPSQRLWHRTSLLLGIPTYGLSISHCGGFIKQFELGLESRSLIETLLSEVKSEDFNYDSLKFIEM